MVSSRTPKTFMHAFLWPVITKAALLRRQLHTSLPHTQETTVSLEVKLFLWISSDCSLRPCFVVMVSSNTNLKICNFLDVSLNLSDGTYYLYRKPNNETLYIDSNSNQPPTIIKLLPAAIGRRISDISSSKELFNQATETTLRKCTQTRRTRRKVNVRWTQETCNSHHTEQPQEQAKKHNLVQPALQHEHSNKHRQRVSEPRR